MQARLNPAKASPEAYQAMVGLERFIHSCGIEHSLIDLVKLRASQINGCAYCVDMHTAEATKRGETQRRLHSVVVWREVPWFTERERAALAWTEALTCLPDTRAPDADFEPLKSQFSEREIANLTLVIVTINGWNRISVGFRTQVPA